MPAQILSAQQSLETLKNHLNKGFSKEDGKRCIKQQLDYLNACYKLGGYYFKLRKLKMAFKYYELPFELDGHSTIIQTDFVATNPSFCRILTLQ